MATVTVTGTPSPTSWYQVLGRTPIVPFTGAFTISVDAASAYPGPSTVNLGVDFIKVSTGAT
jgi:hypothetical protein